MLNLDLRNERRSGQERRVRSGIPLFRKVRRRRSIGRRRSEKQGYVDIYDLKTWVLALSILILSLLDAAFTAVHVAKGTAYEANPLMDMVLSRAGISGFFGIKAAMTALPLAVLVMHKEWSAAKIMVWVCLWVYIVITVYHLYLMRAAALFLWP